MSQSKHTDSYSTEAMGYQSNDRKIVYIHVEEVTEPVGAQGDALRANRGSPLLSREEKCGRIPN